jgi:hypothetical protein
VADIDTTPHGEEVGGVATVVVLVVDDGGGVDGVVAVDRTWSTWAVMPSSRRVLVAISRLGLSGKWPPACNLVALQTAMLIAWRNS